MSFVMYRPEVAVALEGDVLAACLLERVRYWYDKMNGQPFFKFASPCDHPLYKEGDSWTEELGITENQFRHARKKIAKQVKKQTSGEGIPSPIAYWRDRQNRVFYVFIQSAYDALVGQKGDFHNRDCEISQPRPADFPNREVQIFPTDNNKEYFKDNFNNEMDDVDDKKVSLMMLKKIGIADGIAEKLAKEHDARTLAKVINVAEGKRNRAGYVVATLKNGFEAPLQDVEPVDYVRDGVDVAFDNSDYQQAYGQYARIVGVICEMCGLDAEAVGTLDAEATRKRWASIQGLYAQGYFRAIAPKVSDLIYHALVGVPVVTVAQEISRRTKAQIAGYSDAYREALKIYGIEADESRLQTDVA
jgi:hypothetical protein